MDKNLEDLIATYPNFTDPQIQTLLTNKKEFDELQASINEKTPKRGQYYKHQRYFIRVLRATDVIFNIQDTGTGKSCAFIGAGEYFINKGICRHIFILEKGPTTINEMKNQIFCKCTAGVYETEIIRKKEGSVRKAGITLELKKNYTILSYGALAKRIKYLTDEQIINEYSGCFYVIDEAHNLSNSGFKNHEDYDSVYTQLHRFFHLIKRAKIAICTATPMINDVKEIVPLMNLILPLDQQMPYHLDYRFVTLSQVEPYFRGKITYVRSLDTGAKPVYQGQQLLGQDNQPLQYPIEVVKNPYENTPLKDNMAKPEVIETTITSQIKVWPGYMSEFQNNVYKTTATKNVNMELDEDTNNTVHHNEIFSSCFVFPDGSYGGKVATGGEVHTSGLGKYIYSPAPDVFEFRDPPDFMQWSERGNHLTFESWIYNNGDLSNLKKLSCKFANIINLEVNKEGCSFIYSEYVQGPTAIMLCMCFKAFKYDFYRDSASAFISTKKDESICTETNRIMRNGVTAKPRIFFLNVEATDARISSALELFSSKENMDGKYISKVIGTKIARDGINLYNCLRYHCLIPSWHPSGRKQSENRIFRSVSHDFLIEREKERLNNPNANIKIDVDIYNHTAISETNPSIDLYIYQHSEQKDFYISRIFRFMKQCAVDCRTNYIRNVRPTDVDYSAQCDYNVCKYTCVTAADLPTEENMDYSTYDILYTDEAVESCIDEICKLLQIRGSISYNDIINKFVPEIYRERVIYLAISKIIEKRIKIVNRLGFDCFIVSDGSILFTQLEYPSSNLNDNNETVKDLSIYSQDLISIETKTFSQNKTSLQESHQEQILDKLRRLNNPEINPDYDTAITLIKSLIFEAKLQLIEDSILDIIKGNPSKLSKVVKHYYDSYIFSCQEPIENIENSKKVFFSKSKEQINLSDEIQSQNVVYLNTFKSSNIETATYAEISRFRKNNDIRIYNPKETLGWRDVLPYELPSYNKIITNIVKNKFAPYELYSWYGIILNDKFLIRDRSTEDVKTTERSRKRGINCQSIPIIKLLEYIVDAKIEINEIKNIYTEGNTTQLINMLQTEGYSIDYLKSLSADSIVLLYKWQKYSHSNNNIKNKICPELRRWLEANNRLINV